LSNHKPLHNRIPVFIVGAIEGIIVILAIFCFMQAQGTHLQHLYLYTTIAIVFIAALLYGGAYYTRKEELDASDTESKTLKIYKALDIDDRLKDAMIADTIEEKKNWELSWQHEDNVTSSLTPQGYASSMLLGFITGSLFILLNNYFMQMPDYKALLLPLLVLGFLGYTKYKYSNKNPLTGMLLIALSGIAAAVGAYYAGGFFI
jgi:VIT family.